MLRATLAGPVDLLALHRLAPADYPFLLQSVAGHTLSGRYDILFAFPSAHLTCRGAEVSGSAGVPRAGDFFNSLSAWAMQSGAPGSSPSDDLPFIGGWFLLLGYEMAGQIEPRLRLPGSPFRLPDALAVRCPAAVIYDRERQQTHLLAENDAAQLRRLENDLSKLRSLPQAALPASLVTALREEPAQKYTGGVARVLDYLRAGDAFQVNLSRAWSGTLAPGVTAADIYERLRLSNPAPFAGLAAWEGTTVLSSSPERLVSRQGLRVQTRPIAGTRPRGMDPGTDRQLREQLIANVKERAEHIMLIDLERNDLGRVCEPGSVEVSELMTVESYEHVHHIVSNVRGRLRPDAGPGEILKAVFPGGTITGCPKVRAMEIIAELEGAGRGPYTGAMGYLSRDGKLDSSILIRSLVCEDGQVSLRAGAGIVADSKPELELAETRTKARGLLAALGVAA
jgi:anthranilate synthase component 1